MSRIGKSLAPVLFVCQISFTSGVARAEDPAAAEVLFQEGRRLLAEGQVSAACEKLKESFALDAMSGTLLNLAACYEKAGRTATAWARFRNAASLAKSQGKTDQAAEANRRIKALEAELSYLTINVPEPVPGLEVRRNDSEVSPTAFGVEVPVDPGRVEVVASAPGYKSVRLVAEIGANHDKQTISVPKLVLGDAAMEKNGAAAEDVGNAAGAPVAPAKPSEAVEPAKDESARGSQQPAEPLRVQKPQTLHDGPGATPWIIGGFGVAAAATGGIFGYLATRSDKDATNACPTRQHCSTVALDDANRRDQQAMIANIGVGLGLAGIATAAIWLLVDKSTHHGDESARVSIQPQVSNNAAALWATGRF